jgi:hypothetical protein
MPNLWWNITIKTLITPIYPNDLTITTYYTAHSAAILRNLADISTHLLINDLDPITVILSNNAFSEQQQEEQHAFLNDCQHFFTLLRRTFLAQW